MKYHIWTIGCQMNTADSQRLGSQLEKLGYEWSDDAETADVVVLNTCVVRQQAEDKIYGRLGALKPAQDANPDLVIGLMGCLVGHKPSSGLKRRFPQVDVFIPPSETAPLTDLLKARALDAAAKDAERLAVEHRWGLQDAAPGELRLPAHEAGDLVSAHVPVVYGCNWVCTFCIIPSRRGPERSRPADELVAEAGNLASQGVKEITLLGQIVDRYGYDWGAKDALADLLRRLNDVDGLERIRFLTSHPKFMTDTLLDAVAELPKVMEHIEVPVQAGHDRTLERMKRGYTVDEYRALIRRVRDRIPDVAVHTDIIVGFCGETEAEFEATYALLEELRFDKVHLAKFSTRPGTVAAKLYVDDVSEAEKERRRKRLDELQTSVSDSINAANLGTVQEVLVERRDGDRWRGRTRRNKLVFFEDPRPLLGRLVDVEITWTGPWSMVGRVRGQSPQPKRDVIALELVS